MWQNPCTPDVVGVYDVVDRSMTSYSAPNGLTSTWEAISVVGLAVLLLRPSLPISFSM